MRAASCRQNGLQCLPAQRRMPADAKTLLPQRGMHYKPVLSGAGLEGGRIPTDHKNVRSPKRSVPDLGACHERARNGACFVCGIGGRDPNFAGHRLHYEDDRAMASSSQWSARCDHSLVAPKEHRGHVTADFTVGENLGLQRVAPRVAERMYVKSLGLNHGGVLVRWHAVTPLPPGVTYEGQKFTALMVETPGVPGLPEEEQANLLAGRVRGRMGQV